MLSSNRFSIFLQQISDAEFPCEQGFYFGAIFQGIHLPVMQPQDLAGGSVQLPGDVGGKKYASRSVLHDILHTVNEILPKKRIQPGGRLIHQKKAGIVGQGKSKLKPHLKSRGEQAELPVRRQLKSFAQLQKQRFVKMMIQPAI